MPQVILASTSVYRKKQLEQLCIPFIAMAPLIDEEKIKDQSLAPQSLAEMLALSKAQSLKTKFPKDIIIGCDQLVSFENQIYGKSHTLENACSHLRKLQGKTQELITSVCILSEHQDFIFTDITRITLKKLSPEQIKNYVELDQSWDAAGSIKIELHGMSLVENIQTQDYTSITGLPLLTLSQILNQLNVPFLT